MFTLSLSETDWYHQKLTLSSASWRLPPLHFQIDEPNGFGNTPLHVACYMGQEAVATELVNHGANVNQPNKCGYTPLHLAAVSTNGALCLELLVNNGADVNQQVRVATAFAFRLQSKGEMVSCFGIFNQPSSVSISCCCSLFIHRVANRLVYLTSVLAL